MPLCVLGAGKIVTLAVAGFALSWTHTVERVPWQEEWRVEGDRLVLETSRIKGSGAGMEPPPEARLVDGWYVWHPEEPRPEIVLRRATEPGVGDWTLCTPGDGEPRRACRPLGEIVDADPVTLRPCGGGATDASR
ncbi:DUF1850 domain-containing protein [Lutibaculum baratangense]|uniref:DUF1850 domain-containing protein n=1 Tax=Lutibaculum baratangense AMV1 TaxID=631454 RepID=V4RAK3_9HYPH|nr:DUF1850 domain-containing protein [Lutibaculum baratangense]ESR22404.1 DUF1850 domain-containing protein [Lutibaculum baratangense AMV1]